MAESSKIIIVGAGTVGRYLSELLETEKHEVVVIDTAKPNLEILGGALDIQTLHGHGADPAVLTRAGVKDAELLLALTNVDEVNVLAAFTAKRLGAKTVVARARSSWCLDTSILNLGNSLGIDFILNPEHLTAMEIVRFLDHPDALALGRFAHGKIQLRAFTLEPQSKFAGKQLKECRLPKGVLVAVVAHEGEVCIPTGETRLEPGDKITVIGVAEELPAAQKLFHSASDRPRKITIAGGGVTGLHLAEQLERRSFQVKLVEWDRDRCDYLSERLNQTQVVHGDATDKGFMKEERIDGSDVFIGVTGDDENNLMSCLLAKEMGVPQSVVNIARPDYASLVEKFGIDLALSPRHVMANRILTLVGGARIQRVMLLEDAQVEVIELVAEHGSPMVGKPLSDLTVPEGALIGAIVHLGQTIIPRGEHQVEPGDTVVAIGLREAMDALEESFRGD